MRDFWTLKESVGQRLGDVQDQHCEGRYFRPSSSNRVSLTRHASRPRLLLGQVDGGGLGSDGDAVLVQHFNQNLSDVFVVRVKVEDVAHHVGQTLVGEFLLGGVKERGHTGRVCYRSALTWLRDMLCNRLMRLKPLTVEGCLELLRLILLGSHHFSKLDDYWCIVLESEVQ